MSGPSQRRLRIALGLGVRQRPGRPSRGAAQSRTSVLQPALELWGILDVKAAEEVAPIKRERFLPASAPDRVPVRVVPSRVVLRGPDAAQQLAVESVELDASIRDATREATFASSDPEVAADICGPAEASGADT